jgi:hypothetical protein
MGIQTLLLHGRAMLAPAASTMLFRPAFLFFTFGKCHRVVGKLNKMKAKKL